jgi:hypothetical protein
MYISSMVAALVVAVLPLIAFQGNSQLVFYGGIFDIMREQHKTFEMGMEYQWFPNWKVPLDFIYLRPLAGIMATAQKDTYLYGGMNFDVVCGHFIIAPGLCAGWYNQGRGKNLGSPLEFRTNIDVTWQWPDLTRIALRFYHLSNAGLSSSHRNPGSESIVILFGFPIFYEKPCVRPCNL